MNTIAQQELNSCLLTIYIAIGLSDGSLGTNEGKTILAKAKQLYENTSIAEAEFNRIKNHLELLSVPEIWDFLSAKIEASVHEPLLRKELQNSLTEIIEADGLVSETELSFYRKICGLLLI